MVDKVTARNWIFRFWYIPLIVFIIGIAINDLVTLGLFVFGTLVILCYYNKNIARVTAFLITLFVTGFIANQIVQPLFVPRVSDITITPLFIRSIEEDYYLIARVAYTLDVPLFPILGSNEINVRLPTSQLSQVIVVPSDSQPNIELITTFKENTPNINVDIFGDIHSPEFLFTDSVNLTLETNGFSSKVLTQNLYVREKLDAERFIQRESISYSNRYWWNFLSLAPIWECPIRSSYPELLGYGMKDNRYYAFYMVLFENTCNLKVEGFKFDTTSNYDNICDGEIELRSDKERASIDLKPHEIRKIILISEKKFTEGINEHDLIFDFPHESSTRCYYTNKLFEE